MSPKDIAPHIRATIVDFISTSSKIIKSFLRGIQAIAEEFEKETTKGLKKQHRPKKKKAA